MLDWFLTLSLLTEIFIIYLTIINIVCFFYIGLDKVKAQLAHSRIRETTLWILCLIGGSLGGLLGMHYFRHKTKKQSFQAVLAVILVIQVWIIYIMAK
jgi:uncharacterized membrane protein YsdA (DUF1294 family)